PAPRTRTKHHHYSGNRHQSQHIKNLLRHVRMKLCSKQIRNWEKNAHLNRKLTGVLEEPRRPHEPPIGKCKASLCPCNGQTERNFETGNDKYAEKNKEPLRRVDDIDDQKIDDQPRVEVIKIPK